MKTVRFLETCRDLRWSREFKAGKSYVLADDSAAHWIKRGLAVEDPDAEPEPEAPAPDPCGLETGDEGEVKSEDKPKRSTSRKAPSKRSPRHRRSKPADTVD